MVLDLSEKTHGNCTGLGLAEFCTKRLFEKIDYRAFYTNHLTSTTMTGAKIPMIMETARMAVQAALKTSNAPDPDRQRVVHIANTLSLEHILISEGLLEEAKAHPQIEIAGPPQDWAFADEAAADARNGLSRPRATGVARPQEAAHTGAPAFWR